MHLPSPPAAIAHSVTRRRRSQRGEAASQPATHRRCSQRASGASFCFFLLAVLWLAPARAADPLVDSAVLALSQLTDPARLASLPDDAAVQAQLGPALGWLHVARRHDVSPESVIARAFQRNGLGGGQAEATRASLLRNLARADGWELFTHVESARALAYGRPSPIPVGLHQGQLARARFAVFAGGVYEEALRPTQGWDFASLSLRADDEPAPRSLAAVVRRRVRQKSASSATGKLLPVAPPTPHLAGSRRTTPHVLPPPIIYDDPLPVSDP